MGEPERKRFGETLQRLRDDAHLSQAELAAKASKILGNAELTAKSIGEYETGKHVPRQPNARALAEALGLPKEVERSYWKAWGRARNKSTADSTSGPASAEDVQGRGGEGDAPEREPAHTSQGSGGIFFVPNNLPPHYVERHEALEQVRAALLDRDTAAIGIVAAAAVHGQGGLGKTVLARAICDDPAVRAAFPDGVLWATLGQQADPLRHQRNWIRELGGDVASAANLETGTVRLRELLADKAGLLVLDDVWARGDATALQVGGPRCRALLTTRDASLVDGATIVPLDVLSPAESSALLRASTRGRIQEVASQTIAGRLGHLPLALDIVGTLLRSGTIWSDVAEALDEGDLRFLDYAQRSVLEVLAASVKALSEGQQQRYHELVIFPRAQPLDEAAVATLWNVTAGLKAWQCRRLLGTLRERALLQADFTLHDLQLDYLHAVVPATDQQRLHGTLSDAYLRSFAADNGASWASGAGAADGARTVAQNAYPWRWLAWHLHQAERVGDLRTLVTDTRYLERKIALLGTEAAASDARLLSDDTTMQVFVQALRLSGHVLDADPEQLVSQLTGRLGVASPLQHTEADGVRLRLTSQTLIAPGGPLIQTLAHTARVQALAFSPDGRTLAVGGGGGVFGGEARLYDAATGEELTVCSVDAPLLCCAWHPTGTWIAAGDARGVLHRMRFDGH